MINDMYTGISKADIDFAQGVADDEALHDHDERHDRQENITIISQAIETDEAIISEQVMGCVLRCFDRRSEEAVQYG